MDAVTHRRRLQEAVDSVRERHDLIPRVAMILGSGLGDYAAGLSNAVAISYGEIMEMPVSRVEGHAGNLVIGQKGSTPVVVMQGRVHLYEGHDGHEVAFGVRLMAELGAEALVVTNAAGAVNADFEPGDLMVIDDHLNLTGTSSLIGPNLETVGPRFVDMTEAYDRALIGVANASAKKTGVELKHGVYAGLLGPAYETPAEVRMLQTLGADAVGMSTVLEVIAARHRGMRVLGISCITNLAAGLGKSPLSHDEVKKTADRASPKLAALLDGVLGSFP